MAKVKKIRKHVHYHRDGSVWARGQLSVDDVMSGYWEWFRKDGSKMRSGYFEEGEQVGEWITYDRKGKVVKVTKMKAKAAEKPSPKKALKKPATQNAVKKRPATKKSAKR